MRRVVDDALSWEIAASEDDNTSDRFRVEWYECDNSEDDVLDTKTSASFVPPILRIPLYIAALFVHSSTSECFLAGFLRIQGLFKDANLTWFADQQQQFSAATQDQRESWSGGTPVSANIHCVSVVPFASDTSYIIDAQFKKYINSKMQHRPTLLLIFHCCIQMFKSFLCEIIHHWRAFLWYNCQQRASTSYCPKLWNEFYASISIP